MDILWAFVIQCPGEEKVGEGFADAGGAMRGKDEGLGRGGVLEVVTHCVDELLKCEFLPNYVVAEVGIEAVTHAWCKMGVP